MSASGRGFRLALSVLTLAIGLAVAGASVSWAQTLRSAPPNPEFLDWAAREAAGTGATPGLDQGGPALGWRPSPLDLSHLKDAPARAPADAPAVLPSSYDLRTLSRLTSVKDQNPWGTCWSFATYASMESCLLIDQPAALTGEIRDFSEKHLANMHGFDPGYNDGGNADMSIAYLARGGGPVDEADDPYPVGTWSSSPSGLTVQKHVKQVRLIPGKTSATDHAAIKQAIIDHGAVYVSYYHNDAYYSATHRSYYYSGTANGNHAVSIVGWDDAFDRTRFNTTAPGHGAYIVKNSWGTGWGDSGYFYVSYYDGRFAMDAMYVFLSAEPMGGYSRIHQYDPLGWTETIGTGDAPTLWGANVFQTSGTGELHNVGFYAVSMNMSYEVYVYTGVSAGNPRSGTLAATVIGAASYPGYRTVAVGPVLLGDGERFSIVVRFSTPGFNYPGPVESAWLGYSSRAKASAGQSYVSTTGTDWYDLTTDYKPSANFCIKGFTSGEVVEPATDWTTTYAAVFDGPAQVDLFRAYRDRVLMNDAAGKAATEWLYAASEEALAVLNGNPVLLRMANERVRANGGAIEQALAGKIGVVEHTQPVLEFLALGAEKAPAGLRALALNARTIILEKQAKQEPFMGLLFKPIEAPVPVSPFGGVSISTRRPAFEWAVVANANLYEIRIKSAGGTDRRVLVGAPPWTPLAGLPDGLHRWEVRARLPRVGFGEWSSAAEFVVDSRR